MRSVMRKWSRTALTILLTLSMVLGLAACGGKSNNNANEEAKKYVYRLEDMGLELTEGNQGIYTYTYANDRFYLLVVENFWDAMTGMVVSLKSFKEDGSDMQTVELLNTLQKNPNYWDYSDPDISIDSDFSVDPGFGIDDNMSVDVGVPEEDAEEDEPEETVPPEERPLYDEESGNLDMPAEDAEQEVPEDDTDTNERVYRDVYMGSYGLDNSGVYFMLYDNSYTYDANGYYMPLENKRTICSYGLDGTLRMEKELSENDYFSYILGDKEGNLVLMNYDSQMQIVDTQGNLIKKEDLDFGSGWMRSAFIGRDGKVYMVVIDGEYTKLTLKTYNLQTLSFEDDQELPSTINNYGSPRAGLNYDIIMSNSNGLFGYNFGDEEPVQIFSYINSDVDYSYVDQLIELDENRMMAAIRDPETWDYSLGILTYVPPEEVPDKQAILLACNYLGWDLRERIIKFNRENEQYRVVVEIYSQYNTMDDYGAGVTRLNNDIVSGKIPDILVMDAYNMPIDSYIAKGVLADIGKLIEADEEMNWDDFMTNVFDAYSVKGKLYSVIPSFTIPTVLGKTSIVGEEPGMTMDDLKELMKQYPNASVFGQTMTRSSMLWYVMMYSGSLYINRDTGKCNFDSEEFISMLEFIKQFPEEFDYEANPDYWMNYETEYRENRTLLQSFTLYNISDYNYTSKGYFGEPVTFIGFPNSTGIGAVVQADTQYGISARSANKDGAWEFLRYYLTPEYQEGIWQMPILKEALQKQLEEAQERPYWTDSEGNKEYYDNYFWLNGEQIIIDPMTKEEADALYDYIASVDMAYYIDEGLSNIITEEVDAFFLGQKTAGEVAEIIQSRAQVYINESR